MKGINQVGDSTPYQNFQNEPKYPGYPHRAAVLTCGSDWDQIWEGKLWQGQYSLCRQMEFRSISSGSAVERISLLGHRNGTISLSLYFSVGPRYGDAFEKYLRACGLTNFNKFCVPNGQMCCEAKTHAEMKTLFQIVSKHNTFPIGEYSERMRQIVEQGYCEHLPAIWDKEYNEYWKRDYTISPNADVSKCILF